MAPATGTALLRTSCTRRVSRSRLPRSSSGFALARQRRCGLAGPLLEVGAQQRQGERAFTRAADRDVDLLGLERKARRDHLDLLAQRARQLLHREIGEAELHVRAIPLGRRAERDALGRLEAAAELDNRVLPLAHDACELIAGLARRPFPGEIGT